ncbi:MAG: hypothetical protein ACOH5I_04675 [Oligoflexus sp.]
MDIGRWIQSSYMRCHPNSLYMKIVGLIIAFIFISTIPTQVNASNEPDAIYVPFEDNYRFNREDSISSYIDNPALASGLVTGARTLNQSVDSLMESIFYNLMDQQFPLPFGDNFSLVTQYERNLHETAFGTYIVVDQFRLGPRYSRGLGHFENIPIQLGAETGVDVINVTHRSDAARAAEISSTPFWQLALQNWFGILPLLTRILPPSFNPLELYDPITYLKTPFLFPENAEDVEKMPVGSIRSIGISGGISISMDALEPELDRIRHELRLNDLQFRMPYGVFKTGIHRLHVLKKTEHVVWLAVTDQRDLGHKFETNLRNNFKIFSQLIPMWEGVRAPVFPIDYLISRANVKRFDELFSFDLRITDAREDFKEALKGNLIPAAKSAKNPQNSGVIKYFDRTTKSFDSYQKTTRSIYVQHSDRRQNLSRSVVTIQEDTSNHYYLEVEQAIQESDWNVLVGAERVSFDSQLVIKVLKAHSDDKKTIYLFDPEDPTPFALSFSLGIQDRFLDTKDYHSILNLIRYTTFLPLTSSVPDLPILAQDEVEQFYRDHALLDPMDRHRIIEPTPVHLGRIYAKANIYFPYQALMKIKESSIPRIRQAIRAGFSKEKFDAAAEAGHKPTIHWLKKVGSWFLFPLKLFNLYIPAVDYSVEEDRLIAGITQLQAAAKPEDFTEAFETILQSPYPAELIRSLVYLSGIEPLPRRAEFTAQAQSNRHDSSDIKQIKREFSLIDQITIEAGPPMPPAKTYQYVKEKLAAFSPTSQREESLAPRLLGAHMKLSKGANELFTMDLTLHSQKTQAATQTMYVYLRLEQGGSVNIGRFNLGETVIPIPLDENKEANSPIRLFLGSAPNYSNLTVFPKALKAGSDFDLYITISEDQKQWGHEQLIRFTINEKGELYIL